MAASEGPLDVSAKGSSAKGDPSDDPEIKRLTAAIEEAAKHLNGLSVTYLALVVYVVVTLGSIDDVALLVGRAVRLPLLDADVPLRQFLWVAPCFVFALHSHMLMQLGRLRARVCSLTEAWGREQVEGSEPKHRVRNEWFFPFPPIEIFLASKPVWKTPLHQERYLPRLVILLLYVLVYAILPLGTLLLALHKAVLYHTESLMYFDFMVLALGLAVVSFKFPIRPCSSLPKREWWLQKTLFFIFVGGYAVLLPVYCQLEEGSTCPEGGFHRHLDLAGEDLVDRKDRTGGSAGALQLRGRNLRCAVLRGANLRGADLRGTDLSQADLQGADLQEVVLVPADLWYRRWGDLPILARETELLNRRGDTLEEISRLDGANLAKANLAGSQLAFASMRGAILTDAVLGLADLTGVDARGTDFRRSHLEGVSLLGAQLAGANFTRARLTGASLRLAELVGATLLGTRLELADLSGSLLTGASLVDAEAQGASFDGMEGRLVDMRGGQLDGSQGLTLVESVLAHAEVFRTRWNLRSSDIREVDRSTRPIDLGGLVKERLEEIEPNYGKLPGWARWVSEMTHGKDRPEPSRSSGSDTSNDPGVCDRGLVWSDLGGEARDASGRPCKSVEKKDFYLSLAREMLRVLRTDARPFLRRALIDRVCGAAVPRLRDLEDVFSDPGLESDLRTVLESLSEDGLKSRCPLLEELEKGG